MTKVGLEIHIYPKTSGKMFCGCSADFLGSPPNTNTCPVCSGQPGSKPMQPNSACIAAGIAIANGLSMKLGLGPVMTMRKHYFYPDLPSNYQRTAEPLAVGGTLHGFALKELHWEEDPGQYDTSSGEVDLNRSGVPLLELVTEPVMESADDARLVLNDLLLLLHYLGVVREEMPFKVDTNISVGGGARVEVKNINSISGVVKAVEFEQERQTSIVRSGMEVEQETRHFDELNQRTLPMRYKESAEDYRYMRDPDIMPVDVRAVRVEEVQSPFALMREMEGSGVREEDARTILADRNLLRAHDEISAKTSARFSSIFVARDLRGEINFRKIDSSFVVQAQTLKRLLSVAEVYAAGKLSNQTAASLLRKVFDGRDVSADIAELSGSFAGKELIESITERIIAEEAEAADRYRRGNRETINYFVGLCMKELHGRARAQDVLEILRRKLNSYASE